MLLLICSLLYSYYYLYWCLVILSLTLCTYLPQIPHIPKKWYSTGTSCDSTEVVQIAVPPPKKRFKKAIKPPKMFLHRDMFYFSHTLICFTCLCACLHPPPGVAHLILSPVYLYLCSLFVCCHFVLFVRPTSVCSPAPFCFLLLPAVLYLSPPHWIIDPFLHWPWDCLPFWTLCTFSGLLTPACLWPVVCLPLY
jgi:hypothetical protein